MNVKQLGVAFRDYWRGDAAQKAVMTGYRALRAHPFTITDIARRNYVLQDIPGDLSERHAAICEGRRQCALEIMRLTRTELDDLLKVQT